MKLCKNIYKKIITFSLVVSLVVMSGCNSRQNSNNSGTKSTENPTPDISAGFLPGVPNRDGDNTQNNEKETTTASPAITTIPVLRDEEDAETVNTSSLDYTGKLTFNGSSASSSGKNITISGTTATITAGGTYHITGKLTEGQLVIDASDNKKVTLVFDNVEMNNSSAPCIHVLNTKKLVVILKDNSTNIISCTAAFDDETAETDATFYSKEDLVLKGDGKLIITSASNGITSNDSLEIYGGTYEINADNNGLKGKDNVYIENCNITVTAGNDGIKSTTTDDASLGYVAIAGGNINITASGDGIQAETSAFISGGTISIVSGGGSANVAKATQGQQFNPFWGQMGGNAQATDEASCKGIKAGVDITIDAGTINIDSTDDALHSNTNMTINGGEFTLASGDDGMHSDTLLTINGGTINITKSYEGIESADIIFNDGYITIMSSDDGINAAGGNDDSQASGMWGGDRFNPMGEAGDQSVTINGGYIYMNASGDGLDSNGNINMKGGTVIVNGPTNSGNGSLDFGGTFSYNGGSLIVSGSSGMLQTPTASSSTVNSICIVFTSTIAADSVIKIEDENGNEILSYSSPKAYNALIVGSSLFEEDKSYKIYANGTYTEGTVVNGVYSGGSYSGTEYATITISGNVTTHGSAGGMGPGGMGPGGMRPGGNMGGGMRPGGR